MDLNGGLCPSFKNTVWVIFLLGGNFDGMA